MSTNGSIPRPNGLLGEIENVLANGGEQMVPLAATTEWLAEKLGTTTATMLIALLVLRDEGKLMTRKVRSGHTLWKLRDDVQDKWDSFAGPGTFAGRS